MLAPEPFFQPRGTPISVYFRVRALADLGHQVDLVTYPLGTDAPLPNLRVFRVPNVLGLKSIKIGPSTAKLPLDALLFLRAAWRVAVRRYDILFTHEEAALFGAILGRLARVPHVYDMHSSLPQQLANFDFSRSTLLRGLFVAMEDFYLKRSRAVIVICRDLLDKVTRDGHGDKAHLIENVLEFPSNPVTPDEVDRLRKAYAPGGEKIVLYAGNFQHYQGIGLLLEAAARVEDKAVFVLLGGTGADLEAMKRKAAGLGISGKVVFVDKVPPARVALFLALADVLVSPRLAGTNTPLKIYSFLKSGKPLVATNLWTHTQMLDEAIAVLVEPEPGEMARGISFALSDPEAARRARAAKDMADREYTRERYTERIRLCLETAVSRRRRG
ncbi:MAG: glycosyltransferase family 4 protein [Candidatus Aminicenantes bacterium]|nr:glycosyltransferase family 4 protein [Candidatus Aminicenantes bacterium]